MLMLLIHIQHICHCNEYFTLCQLQMCQQFILKGITGTLHFLIRKQQQIILGIPGKPTVRYTLQV